MDASNLVSGQDPHAQAQLNDGSPVGFGGGPALFPHFQPVPATIIAGDTSPAQPARPHRPQPAPRPPLRTRKAPEPAPSPVLRRLRAGQPIVAPGGNLSPAYVRAKRAMDFAAALTLLVVLSPLILLTLLVLWVTTRGRPIFRQTRLGHCGRPFVMYKFRTMVLDADLKQREVANEKDGPVFKNRRDPRITRIGRLLRRTSVDELPQLVNVLLGHMSLVGPRPPLAQEAAQYQPWQRNRLAVKPGLTCLWQVSGRCEIGFDDWVRMDLWYLRNQSLLTDLRLLWKTPASVLSARGAY